jgi:hypothetical protein
MVSAPNDSEITVLILLERETYDMFDAADGDFEELGDDFVLLANDG